MKITGEKIKLMEEREGERKQRRNKREGKEKTRKELMKIRSSRIMNEREMNGKKKCRGRKVVRKHDIWNRTKRRQKIKM